MSEPGESDLRHLPIPDADSEPFWRAAREGRLVCRRCTACGHAYHYPRARCPRCLSAATEWIDLSGEGTVYSYTVVHQAASRAFRDRVPYVLALVDLDEGPRLLTNLVEVSPASVTVGLRVRVDWRAESDDAVLPVFRPLGAA